jgi:hypothetical protein
MEHTWFTTKISRKVTLTYLRMMILDMNWFISLVWLKLKEWGNWIKCFLIQTFIKDWDWWDHWHCDWSVFRAKSLHCVSSSSIATCHEEIEDTLLVRVSTLVNLYLPYLLNCQQLLKSHLYCSTAYSRSGVN